VSASQRVRQLPSKVVRVLHTGVQSLTSGRRVHVRRVASEKHAADSIPIDHADLGAVQGHPAHSPRADPLCRAVLDETSDPLLGHLGNRGVATQNRGQLKAGRARQRTESEHASFGKRPHVPRLSIHSLDLDIGEDESLALKALAVQPHAERFSNEAVSAIAAYQVLGANLLDGAGTADSRRYAVIVLPKAHERLAELWFGAELE
jgi:hypothetical protein